MEKDYKKVVVFTPMSVLEEVSMDETVHHEDILETMFEENLWIPYNEESKDFLNMIFINIYFIRELVF